LSVPDFFFFFFFFCAEAVRRNGRNYHDENVRQRVLWGLRGAVESPREVPTIEDETLSRVKHERAQRPIER